MDLGKKLTELRKASGYSQQDVAAILSKHTAPITNRAVSKWETGASYPDAFQFIWLCELYGVTDVVSEFLDMQSESPYAGLNRNGIMMANEFISLLRLSDVYSSYRHYGGERRVVPLYDLAVSSGTGVFLDSDSFEQYEAEDVPPEANFAVRVSGDSMEPRFRDGQIVYAQSMTELASGEIGIFVYNGDAHLRILDRTDGIRLVALNEKYKPINIKYAYELRVVGRVII